MKQNTYYVVNSEILRIQIRGGQMRSSLWKVLSISMPLENFYVFIIHSFEDIVHSFIVYCYIEPSNFFLLSSINSALLALERLIAILNRFQAAQIYAPWHSLSILVLCLDRVGFRTHIYPPKMTIAYLSESRGISSLFTLIVLISYPSDSNNSFKLPRVSISVF